MALSDNPPYRPFEITEDLFDTAKIIWKFIKPVELKPKDLQFFNFGTNHERQIVWLQLCAESQ
ncbi:hypothetical protein [Aggregatibacter aphrophilus]|uniref:hypothetical protein n=1 Tax=Aggregatibacter aphrophilus TaxID=732 RepID=UPI001EF661E8|nr:hypothetical protein [Aggregatibacter aphrophilus]